MLENTTKINYVKLETIDQNQFFKVFVHLAKTHFELVLILFEINIPYKKNVDF